MNANQKSSAILYGFVLMTLGVIFLAGQFMNIRLGENLWPLAIIGSGVLCLIAMVIGGRSTGGLAVPGSMTVATGLVLLVQNTFKRYNTWAYAWALIMAAFGIGMVINGYWSGLEMPRRNGWVVARMGALFFILFGAFFELFVYRHSLSAGNLWPVALILVGAGLIVYRFIGYAPSQKS